MREEKQMAFLKLIRSDFSRMEQLEEVMREGRDYLESLEHYNYDSTKLSF